MALATTGRLSACIATSLFVALLGACRQPGSSGGLDTPAGGDGGGAADGGSETDGGDSGEPSDGGAAEPDDSGDGGGGDTGETGVLPTGPPVAVIVFIGDGMGPLHVAGGGQYAYGSRGSLRMEAMPYEGRIKTASLTGYTDSAAAATAMATGVKTWNGVIGMDGDVLEVQNILERARELGLATGVVTTDGVYGATPASFMAHVSNRGSDEEIGAQIAASPPDVLLGGGWSTMEAALLHSTATVVTDKTTLNKMAEVEGPLIGIFDASTLPYVYDGYGDEIPSLSEMVAVALDRLEDDAEGFVLMVEGARIDHASHANDTDRVHVETAAFDEAIGVALDRVAGWTATDTTVLVTADHECGGIAVEDGSAKGETPVTTWRWGDHTNADVPVYGLGTRAAQLDGERLDNLWIHAVALAAIEGRDVVEPVIPRLVDGDTSDLGAVVTQQSWDSSFLAGFNQLDALRLTADEEGLWIGVDGVFQDEENTVVVLFDLDYGAGTGLVGDGADLTDAAGDLDPVLATLSLGTTVDGLGFDGAVSSMFATEGRLFELYEQSGLRGFYSPIGEPDDLWWLDACINFDDGNIATADAAAVDAAGVGLTTGGLEALAPWWTLFPDGMPKEGLNIAIAVVLVNGSGDWLSNQALPPYADASEPGAGQGVVSGVVLLDVDADGNALGEAWVGP